ncbi:MAG: C1 family peptidase [Muribaculaceae bacterium]|nr:C1 family peptidase [Muribaculaceae bacterium]
MFIHSAHIFIGAINEIAPIFDEYIKRMSSSNILDYYNLIKCYTESSQLIIENSEVSHKTVNNEDLKRIFRGLYDKSVIIGSSTAIEMKLVFYFVLNEQNSIQEIKRIVDIVNTLNRNFTFEFIGLTPDVINSINGHERDRYVEPSDYSRNVEDIINLKKSLDNFCSRFILIRNRTECGQSLNFSRDSLAIILAEYAQIIIEKYHQLYPQTIYPGDVTGLGVSIMSLDKFYFVNYLKDKAYLKALENINVNQEEVDINKINNVVQVLLKEHVNVFEDFYKKYIKPQIETKVSLDSIVVSSTQQLDSFIKVLYDKITSFIDEKELSLPEKQAVFAVLLGLDDRLIYNFKFANSTLQFDDCLKDSIAILLESNNKLTSMGYDEDGNPIYKPGPLKSPLDDEAKAIYPYDELKKTRTEIVEISSFIRDCEAEIEVLENSQSQMEIRGRRLTKDGFVYNDIVYKSNHKVDEEPLQETYEPSNVIPKNSIDLSKYFTKIKNQGELGSCTVFTITSIYEYILSRNTKNELDLSEGFVFYQTNVKNNNIDGGSTYKEVIDIIAKIGICEEELYPYEKVLTEAPTENANIKASEHQIVKAMNVKVAHKDITSAISEGYPVAISLKIYDSFSAEYNGLISTPTKEEIEKGESYSHAMVICGYDETKKLYKVRNSWGENFGDKGYCYIPYDYIEDKKLNPFCCIITETKDGKVTLCESENEFSINLDETDVFVKSILLKNTVQEQKKTLANKETRYNLLTTLYQQLLIDLRKPEVINNIRKGTNEKLKQVVDEKETEYRKIKEENNKTLDDYKKDTRSFYWINIGLCLFIIAVLLIFDIFNYWWLCCIPLVILIVGWSTRFYRLKLLRNKLNEELANIGSQIAYYKKHSESIDLKLYLSSRIVSKLQEIRNKMVDNYNGVKLLLGNLKVWYSETSDAIQTMDCSMPPPILSVLDNQKLTDYFDDRQTDFVKEVDFSAIIKSILDSEINDDTIKNWKESTEMVVSGKLYNLVGNFNMYSYLAGLGRFEFLKDDNMTLQQLLIKMNGLSKIFVPTNILNANITQNQTVFLKVPDEARANWHNQMTQSFTQNPNHIDCINEEKLIVVTTKELKKQEVVMS